MNAPTAMLAGHLVLLRLPAICSRIASSRSEWYRQIASGHAPRPVKLGSTSVWPEHEIQALIAAHIAGQSREEIRVLVAGMHVARAAASQEAVHCHGK
jgi:prophage regulatory protein